MGRLLLRTAKGDETCAVGEIKGNQPICQVPRRASSGSVRRRREYCNCAVSAGKARLTKRSCWIMLDSQTWFLVT
jgi:hypothetical protein